MRKRNTRVNPGPDKAQNILYLTELLGLLRALQWSAWVTHWQLSGPNFYGDHLLFQRIYGGDTDKTPAGGAVNEQIDTLGEKIVALYGAESFNAIQIQELTTIALNKVANSAKNPIHRALLLEEATQRALVVTHAALREGGSLSLGMDNFLQGIADDRETALYLLRQRLPS